MSGIKKEGAIFLDRDGTVSEEVGHLDSLTKLMLLPQAFVAIEKINKSGLKAIVITNQSGVARGYFTEEFVSEVHLRIQEMLGKRGAHIDAFYYCPHHPTEGRGCYTQPCHCRKPGTGMLLQAAQDLNIDLQLSYMIGDTIKDIEAALRAGAKGVLVRTGYGQEAERELASADVRPDHVADDILAAVHWIMQDRKR